MIDFIKKNKDLALVIGMILILVTLFSPIPPALLDIAIIINFGFALTILLLTFYVQKPVEFSTFPSLLLIATLYRLSLNIASTRLILTRADAGEVIDAIGSFSVGGVFIVGLVVFAILVVVQYVVVTSGAQRVSEVAARFMLDSMPGQQMSIDADLNMGIIDQDEARKRRSGLDKEASFYGAMDGASKFVKGDAIAGIIIVLINIIAGLIIGVVQMDMSWGQSLERFTLLTIGDGIATQLPALIISIATGIIVTRSSSDRDLSTEIFAQLSSVARIPLIVGGLLCGLLLLPGMPKWPIAILLALCAAVWWRMRKASRAQSDETSEDDIEDEAETQNAFPAVAIALGEALTTAWASQKDVLLDRISDIRKAHKASFGLALPAVKIIDGKRIGSHEYEVQIFGARQAVGEVEPDRILAIETDQVLSPLNGVQTREPSFGLPALWIEESQSATARQAGYTLVDPLTVFTTHLTEVLRNEASALLNRSATQALLDGVRDRQPGLVEELVPTLLSVSDIQRLLQQLVAEHVPVGHIDLIVEELVDIARHEKNVDALTERVRQRLGAIICNGLRDTHHDLAVLSLDPRLENQISAAVMSSPSPDRMAIDANLADQLLRQLAKHTEAMFNQGRKPVLLCSGAIRRQLRLLTSRSLPRLSIISVNEIPKSIELSSFDVVKVATPAAPNPQTSAMSGSSVNSGLASPG